MIKIALDAMGTDAGPAEVTQGAILATQVYEDIQIQLFGDAAEIAPLIEGYDRLEVVSTTEVITNEDEPVMSLRRKKDASIVQAVQSVKRGDNDVVISGGSTGATLAGGLLLLGRIKGINRPALIPVLPTISADSKRLLLIDGGANADIRPNNLVQFAILADYYAREVYEIEKPKVGLLSNGSEEGKGNKLTVDTYDLLKETPEIHFVGNVEPNEAIIGEVDILVTDGFTGNIFLKTIESVSAQVLRLITGAIKDGPLHAKLGGAMIKGTLSSTINQLELSDSGAAVLLGVKAPVLVAHGSADSNAILQAIRQGREVQQSQVIDKINAKFLNDQK